MYPIGPVFVGSLRAWDTGRPGSRGLLWGMLALLFAAFAAPGLQRTVLPLEQGGKRFALIHVPKGVENPPVVIAYHGIGGNPAAIARSWGPVAEKQEILLVVPIIKDGRQWFDGQPPDYRQMDLGHFTDWRDWAVEQGGDADRVFVSGFSMGGHFATALVCRGVPVKGVSAIGMSMVKSMRAHCEGSPTPYVYVAYSSDPMTLAGTKRVGGMPISFVSQNKTLARLREVNQCTSKGKKERLEGGAKKRSATCEAPLVSLQVPGDKHKVPPQAARFIWDIFEKL